MPGVGTYTDAEAGLVETHLFGRRLRVISLDQLIAAKRAAGRTKDLLALAELEELRHRLR